MAVTSRRLVATRGMATIVLSRRPPRPDGGSTDGGSAALTGYSIVEAPDLAAAAALAKGCPLLGYGGTVDVYQALPM